jgi:hypothetical protein
MVEKPILFSGEMVRAILAGRKTQTRRVVTNVPHATNCKLRSARQIDGGRDWEFMVVDKNGDFANAAACPYGKPGDQLWVRETWQQVGELGPERWTFEVPTEGEGRLLYAADIDEEEPPKWRPSIHMPRWASRLTLTLKTVRVERLNEISEADAKAEGVNGGCLVCGHNAPCGCDTPSPDHRDSFIGLWDSINATRGYAWDANPWVWVVEFEPTTNERPEG